jgi:hypothetical protein
VPLAVIPKGRHEAGLETDVLQHVRLEEVPVDVAEPDTIGSRALRYGSITLLWHV